MGKRLLAALLTVAGVVGFVNTAGAAPPVRVDITEVVPASESCGTFGVTLHITGKEKDILKGDTIKYVSPGLRVTVSRTDMPSRSASYVITGTIVVRETADGFALVARGRNLIVGPVEGTPMVLLTVGRFETEGRFNPATGHPAFGPVRGNGQIIDVCAALR